MTIHLILIYIQYTLILYGPSGKIGHCIQLQLHYTIIGSGHCIQTPEHDIRTKLIMIIYFPNTKL